MRAHASQISEQSFFLAMLNEAFAYEFGTEWFIRAGRGWTSPRPICSAAADEWRARSVAGC